MKILVTGSAGFIGHHLTRLLLDRGDQVVGLDNLNNYYSPSLKLYRNERLNEFNNYNFYNLDITNRNSIAEIFENNHFDAVIHLAAQAGVRIPVEENYRYTQSNLVGFENISTHVLKQGIRNFIYASSSSVYGDKAKIPLSETETNLLPNSYYGATKLSNEIVAKTLFRDSNTNVRGLRFFSVYGPMGRPDMAYFKLLSCAVTGDIFKLYGDGSIKRDFTYIKDASEITLKLINNLMNQPSGINDLVNVGGGHPMSMLELLQISEKISKHQFKIEYLPRFGADSTLTEADTSLQEQLVSTSPQTTLNEGIIQTYAWMNSEQIKSRLSDWLSKA